MKDRRCIALFPQRRLPEKDFLRSLNHIPPEVSGYYGVTTRTQDVKLRDMQRHDCFFYALLLV